MKLVIGVVGENGAGKGSFSEYLTRLNPDLKVTRLKFSDILFSTLKLWNLPLTRANLQNLSIIMDKQYGSGTLTRATEGAVTKNKSDIVIVEGVRWDSDVPMIHSFKRNALVYIIAKRKIRFERMKIRGEKVGESNLSYSQFLKEEKAKTEVAIGKIGRSADFKIENNGTQKEFERQVKKFIKEFIQAK